MDITPAVPADRQFIQAYGNGGFRISHVRHEGAVLISVRQTWAWPASDIAGLTSDSLRALQQIEEPVEILLVGCGPAIQPLPADLRQELRGWGIVAEPMDTGAACRTYNVLLSEDRRVAAALLPVD